MAEGWSEEYRHGAAIALFGTSELRRYISTNGAKLLLYDADNNPYTLLVLQCFGQETGAQMYISRIYGTDLARGADSMRLIACKGECQPFCQTLIVVLEHKFKTSICVLYVPI